MITGKDLNGDERRAALNAELAKLNEDVEAAISARKKWMDDHMADYAKFKIGDVLYDGDTGRWMGVVTEYYRYHQGDPRFDTSMSIDYRFKNDMRTIDNTSRQPGVWFTTAQQMLDSGRYRANEKEMWERRAANPETLEDKERMLQSLRSFFTNQAMTSGRLGGCYE